MSVQRESGTGTRKGREYTAASSQTQEIPDEIPSAEPKLHKINGGYATVITYRRTPS